MVEEEEAYWKNREARWSKYNQINSAYIRGLRQSVLCFPTQDVVVVGLGLIFFSLINETIKQMMQMLGLTSNQDPCSTMRDTDLCKGKEGVLPESFTRAGHMHIGKAGWSHTTAFKESCLHLTHLKQSSRTLHSEVEIGGTVIVKYWFWQTDCHACDVYEGSTEPSWTELTGINLPAPGCGNLINSILSKHLSAWNHCPRLDESCRESLETNQITFVCK